MPIALAMAVNPKACAFKAGCLRADSELARRALRWAAMIDSKTLKTQTSYSLKLHDVRKAAAAYELMHSAATLLQEQVKDQKGPLTLCDRSFLEHLNELISGARLKEQHLFHGITGIVPHPNEDEKKNR
jgi:hypothetical protein